MVATTKGGIMARRSRRKTLADLEGKLGVIQRGVLEVLRSVKREIARREGELAALKAEYAKGADLLRGRAKPGPVRVKRRARRSRQINWKDVFSSLPARFTLKMLTRHPIAGRRPTPHLYAILSRWKKEGVMAKDAAGGYRKVTKQSKPKRKVRREKPAPTQKPAARPEAAGA
jgi:hypothetical protein